MHYARLVRLSLATAVAVLAGAGMNPRSARAQSPLPPLPPPVEAPPPAAPPPPPPPGLAPPPPPAEPPPGPREYVYVVPPPPPPLRRVPSPRAPDYSFWLGGRLGVLAYGGGVYANPNGDTETTGNFVTNGLALEVDAGARVARHFIPYVGAELGLVGPGHRFEGTSARAGTSFLGIGLRMLAGDVDGVSFISDLSFGFRQIQVSSNGSTWSGTGFEVLRLGLGVDVRLTSRFTLSPLLTLSGGKLTDSSGSVNFAPNQGDGLTGTPDYVNHGQISGPYQTSYEAVVIGCGGHFDLFGR